MSLTKSPFGKMPDGTPVELYTLEDGNGLKAEIIPYGCRIVRLWAKDRAGNPGDVVWGYDTLEDYLQPKDSQGTAVGRCANRIAGAEVEIDGTVCKLTANQGRHQLHSGVGSGSCFSENLWDVKAAEGGGEPFVTFSFLSPDGAGGFPGNLTTEITYTLTGGALKIDYRAKSDKKTVINLTNHTYFNLSGGPSVLNHVLRIDADSYTPADADLIPTGEIVPVAGTPFDFRTPKAIGRDIAATGKGYDNNFVLGGSGLREIAELYDPESGRVMKTLTDLPGVQLYTANSIAPGKTGKNGAKMEPHGSVCLETQYFPDAVHHANFPSVLFDAGEEFKSTTVYQFSVR